MDKLNHKGLNAWRLNDSSHRKEITFAKVWRDLNKNEPEFLSALLGREPNQIEAEVAATIWQWLGTARGFRLIEETIKKCQGLVKV